jgi:RNA polymerase sigma-70 factor (ECF subfamily)
MQMKSRKQSSNSQFEETTFCFMEQLYRLAYSRLGNAQDAEDVIQETYLKAFRGFAAVRDRSSAKNWLTQILINAVRDHRRREKRVVKTVDLETLDEELLNDSNQCSPEEALCRSEIDPLLLRALTGIPESFLTPLLLREIYESSYDQIASILDIPIGTVMSRLYRGRRMLRHALSPETIADDCSVEDLTDEENDNGVRSDEV